MKSVEEFLGKFDKVRKLGNDRWMVRCPSHNDGERPDHFSLSVKELPDKILIHCQAGCDYKSVLKALKLTESDLFFDSPKANTSALDKRGKIEAIYDYEDENGKLIHQTVRYEPKKFTQRRPGKKGEWIWNLQRIRTVLYHLPRVKEAIEKEETIYLPEGEKDADNLISHFGVVASTSPMGAGKWRDRYTQMLTGAKEVVIIADNNSPGQRHAQAIAASLFAVQVPTKILEMPSADIMDISDWISAGLTADQFKELLDGLPPYEPPPPVDTSDLPVIIITGRFLKDKTRDTIAAVEKANQPPRLFERSGSMARISHDEDGVPFVEVVTENACRGFLERAAAYMSLDKEGNEIPVPAPPLNIVRDFMSLPTQDFMGLPYRKLPGLLNVTEVPILRSDGSILTKPGYDQDSRLYYEPAAGLMMPSVPNKPNEEELHAAASFIQEPLNDFPFDSEASKTNALALLLTPVCRPMIDGLAPLCLLDKPQPGTGASLLADVIAVIGTGRQAAMMAPPRSDEECEKRIGSFLLSGQSILIIDNVEGYLYFASLAMLLTDPTFQTRILGQTKIVRLPNRGTYVVTGNNIKLGGDMARRCYLSRMDAHEARPWMRDAESFKYTHLIKWVKENRGQLLGAILTMARAWVEAGRPIPKELPTIGGFEEWAKTIGGILAHAGFTDFLGNLDFMYQQADVETPQWEEFLAALQEVFGSEPLLIDTIAKSLDENETISGALPDGVNRDPKKINRSLAGALRRRAGVRYPNGLMVIKCDFKVHHAVPWQVINYREEPEKGGVRGVRGQKSFSLNADTKGELGELASHPDALSKISKVKEGNKTESKNTRDPNSPNSLLATSQIQNANSPFSEELPASELKKMLEEYVELTTAKIIKLWKKKGSPEVPLGPGVKIGNLETYLAQGIIDIDQLGALCEVVKEWKKEQGEGAVTKKRKRKGG
ncbi:hypothetical protein ES703_01894 [subsurface metagenome]